MGYLVGSAVYERPESGVGGNGDIEGVAIDDGVRAQVFELRDHCYFVVVK